MSSATSAYLELLSFIAYGTKPEAVLNFRPSADVQQRIGELMERAAEPDIARGALPGFAI